MVILRAWATYLHWFSDHLYPAEFLGTHDDTFNNVLSVLKLIIPIVVGLAVIGVAFHPTFFHQHGHLLPISGGITAILSTGIIVNGFQTVVSFASEVDKPARTIGGHYSGIGDCPWGLSVVASCIYWWRTYSYTQSWLGSAQMQAPILELVGMIGLGMLTSIIYFGSVIAPAGTGIAFVGAATHVHCYVTKRANAGYFNAVHLLTYRVVLCS